MRHPAICAIDLENREIRAPDNPGHVSAARTAVRRFRTIALARSRGDRR
jgi:hypothetical protein